MNDFTKATCSGVSGDKRPAFPAGPASESRYTQSHRQGGNTCYTCMLFFITQMCTGSKKCINQVGSQHMQWNKSDAHVQYPCEYRRNAAPAPGTPSTGKPIC